MSEEQLKIGIIMGSDSDLQTMRHARRALEVVGMVHNVDFEERVISAHRTPKAMMEYASTARDLGREIIIAGAGGSAHLPGMVASETTLPVLGVAITDSPDTMNRALGSTIGMPEGKPIATFQGKAGAFNAGLLAVRILALHNSSLLKAYEDYEDVLSLKVIEKDALLKEIGSTAYLAQKP